MLVDLCELSSGGFPPFRSDRGSTAHTGLMQAQPTKSLQNGYTIVGRQPLSNSNVSLIAAIGTPSTRHRVPTLCYSHPTRLVCVSKLCKQMFFVCIHYKGGTGSTERNTSRHSQQVAVSSNLLTRTSIAPVPAQQEQKRCIQTHKIRREISFRSVFTCSASRVART